MHIRSDQIGALQRGRTARFARSLTRLARERLGESVAGRSDGELEAEIQRLLGRAEGYGITADADLIAFVNLGLAVAPNFDEHPVFHGVLADPDIPGGQKMQSLFDAAVEYHWEEAASLGRGLDASTGPGHAGA